MDGTPIILSSSPREGNGAFLARRMAERHGARLIMLREHDVTPCIGCGGCAAHPHDCVFDGEDDARSLLDALCAAPAVVLVAPVYFYGPPAQLKALIDRAQRVWEARPGGADGQLSGMVSHGRFFGSVYTAARTRGDELFTAGRLIVDCFAQVIGCTPVEPLCLRGIEHETDAQDQRVFSACDAWADTFFARLKTR
jgi:multimeric flavodoxin WrbA